MITHRATLDVSRELVRFAAALLAEERRQRGTPRGSRALTRFWQAVLGLRWFRGRVTPGALARDHGISRATAYRYVDEVIAVLAASVKGQVIDLCYSGKAHTHGGNIQAVLRPRSPVVGYR